MDYQSLIRSPNAAALFLLVLQETDNGKTAFQMSQAEISKATGLSRQNIRTAVQTLLKSGALKEVSNQGTNQGTNQPLTLVSGYRLTVCNVQKTTGNQGTNQGTNQGKDATENKLQGLLITHADGTPLTVTESNYNKWTMWMYNNHPYLFKKMRQLTLDNFQALCSKYTSAEMGGVVDSLDGDTKYRQRYLVLSTTMSNWLKKRYPDR